jgi:hypothetical protein
MSLRENEQRRPPRRLREHERQPARRDIHALAEPLSKSHPDQVLTFFEWCRLNRISERTGRRILDGDAGPQVTMLSAKRIGITIGANRAWQDSRARRA